MPPQRRPRRPPSRSWPQPHRSAWPPPVPAPLPAVNGVHRRSASPSRSSWHRCSRLSPRMTTTCPRQLRRHLTPPDLLTVRSSARRKTSAWPRWVRRILGPLTVPATLLRTTIHTFECQVHERHRRESAANRGAATWTETPDHCTSFSGNRYILCFRNELSKHFAAY